MIDQQLASGTIKQFNAAMENIKRREERIETLKKRVEETNHIANDNRLCQKEIKELEELNQRDRDFVKQSIDFYEQITGEPVGSGPLFQKGENNE